MIQPHEITIGSLLRTNKGEIIRVESISTKRQHRKVGYHTPNDPYHIKYVRLAQCEGIDLTPEILMANGFELCDDSNYEFCAYIKSSVVSYIVYVTPLRSKMSIEIADTGHVIFDWFVYSVSQMQHALRLFGLHELAEIIKV